MLKGIIFPASSTVTLEVISALQNHKDIFLIGVNSHENYEYKYLLQTTYDDCPMYSQEKECVEYLINICKNEQCSFIFPTMDMCHFILSKYRNLFHHNNIKIITSSHKTNEICISKELTYNMFCNQINCPKIYNITEVQECNLPLFVKPKVGYGSRCCNVVFTIDELNKVYNKDKLILNYLEGDEFTVDCFTQNNIILYCQARQRCLYKNGLSVVTKSVTSQHLCDEVYKMASIINKTLSFVGGWFFQVKKDRKGTLHLLEISTRIAGASAINRLNGCNLPLLSIYVHFDKHVEILSSHQPMTVYKYLHSKIDYHCLQKYIYLYVDFDDTLVLNGKVNYKLISFLYKWQNDGKMIFLITRHNHDIHQSLKKYNIKRSLFKEIYHILDNTCKSAFICDKSIFIDDSFAERKDVYHSLHNCLVLDTDTIDLLLA